MAASTRVGRRRGQARGGEAGLINNLLLPQASEKGRAASAEEQEREAREAVLAPQALAALAPTVQSPAAVPVS